MSPPRRFDGFVPGRHAIDAYGAGGFRFAEMSHRGSILALPSGIAALRISRPEELTEEVLAPVFREAGAIDVLLVGTGRELIPVPEALRWRLREDRIGVDPMPTGAAARTYNILLAENRRVAAVLIAVD